ncbi:MAG: ATP-binding protein [Desulfuromonadaceae bacterium]
MKRSIEEHLLGWKNESKRKPLIVRGARQVGKTFSVRQLGGTFDHFLEVNFEKDRRIASLFAGSLEPKQICEKLSAYYQIPVKPGSSLLFFDEIQGCPDAIRSLRFFYEELPELHLIAAGSLLEFALSEIPSHGVGRISNLFMHPLSFEEFLINGGHESLIQLIHTATPTNPLDDIFHQKLLDILRIFLIIGGMPEVVRHYLEERDITACQHILDDIILTMRDDFARYRTRARLGRLDEVLHAIPFQAGNKFKYASIDPTVKSALYKESLDMLVKAGLVHRIIHTDARGIPLGAQIKLNMFKTILFDVGVHQRIQRNDITPLLMSLNDKDINRGGIAEAFVGTELLKYGVPHLQPALYYWHREANSSNAEVDYIIQKETEIIPIEVKSGSKGLMQSLHLFLSERNLPVGLRISTENFTTYGSIVTVPLYAVSQIL